MKHFSCISFKNCQLFGYYYHSRHYTNSTKNVLSEVLQSSSINIAHSPKPQNVKEFCEKFTNGICQRNSPLVEVPIQMKLLLTHLQIQQKIQIDTEYRDPTPFSQSTTF
ncbi:hypothetical protein Glove_212g152 [Diversispora epigaea]|uniref:Uncharacterized protein n=1 Tax=Diversispora epigaea TaxID=1348612 RepID=A0A397IIA9_9GLOM|nr:hypothetical protein Glove_212g152 [Diversispora epigaea]